LTALGPGVIIFPTDGKEENALSQQNRRLGQTVPRRRVELALVLALALLLSASLIPVFSISRYARAAADDYCYGLFTHQALRTGGSLLAAIGHTLKGYYLGWQGSFSAMALMTLTPCIFSEHLYWITTVVMLASLICGTLKLAHTLVRRVLKASWIETLLVALPILILSIQLVPAPLEAFFWWNGAVYYTFTYGISLLYVERLVSLFLQPEGRFPWRVVLPGVLWAIVVGGSNYVSALLCAMLGCCFLLFALYKRRCRAGALVLLLAELIPFFASVLAPGNQVRQAQVTSMSPARAILLAIRQAWNDLLAWPNWLTLILCLAWVPLLLRLARASGLSFRLPGVFVVFTFLFFAAQNSPHFYAVSTAGPGRLRDIVYFSHFWVILLDEWYCLGWLQRAVLPKLSQPDKLKKPLTAAAAGALLLLTVGWGWFYAPQTLAAECVRELSDGSAAAFAQEMDQRLAVFQDPDLTDPVFTPLRSQPRLLTQGDLNPDPGNWVNVAQANYWGKNSVNLGE